MKISNLRPEQLPYFRKDQTVNQEGKKNVFETEMPKDFHLSQFHYYVLHDDVLTIVNLISKKLVEHIDVRGKQSF